MTRRVAIVVVVLWMAAVRVSDAAAQGYDYAAADSADAADAALDGVDAGDTDDVTEALALERGDASERTARTSRAFFGRAEVVRGYRASTRVTAGTHRVAVGVYRAGERGAQWVDARPGGWIERVTVGGLRLRAGEGLVLGASHSRFGSARSSVRGALAADPSLSVAAPREGAAVTLRGRGVRSVIAAWSAEDGSRGRWVSLGTSRASGWGAVSGGVLRAGDDPGVRPRTAVSLSGGRDADGVRVSGEVARVGTTVLALVRTAVTAAGEWSAEVFDAGADASGGVVDLDDAPGERERGAALHRASGWGAWNTTSSVYAVARDVPGGNRVRRRVDVSATHTRATAERLDLSMRLDVDDAVSPDDARLADRVERSRTRRARLRARLDVPAGTSASLRYQVQTWLAPGARPGFVAGMDGRWTLRRLDLRASVSNFALWNGGTATVARPGIAGYEVVAPVGRRGSDVSARATLRLFAGTSVSVYAGVPWGREARTLVSVVSTL